MSQVSYGTITITDTTDIERIYVEYCRSTSNQLDTSVNPPVVPNITVAWSENTPPWVNGQYIWQRSVVKKSGSTNLTYGTPVCLTGAAGATGAAGQSLTATKTEYTIAASNVTINLSNHTSYTWTTNTPDYDSSKPAYWGRITNTYTNPTKTEYLFYKDEALTKAVADAAIANSVAQHANEDAQGAMAQAASNVNSVTRLWYLTDTASVPTKPDTHVIETSTSVTGKWTRNKPTKNNYRYYYYCDEICTGGGVYSWTDVVADTLSLTSFELGLINAKIKNHWWDSNGLHFASGINNAAVTTTNANTYGYIGTLGLNGLTLGYNSYKAMELLTNVLNFYQPPIIGSTTEQGNKTMALTGNALRFYNPSDGITEQAILDANGLKLLKGGVESGDLAFGNGYVYLSTEDKTGIEINEHNPKDEDPKWRVIIGSKFGVDSEGDLYAAGANIEGAITATQLTISGGGATYDGASAINANGYTIEIIEDKMAAPTGSIITENQTYLYPVMYLNGVAVTTGITKTNYIWYTNENTATTGGVAGDSTNGGIIATYGNTYRVTYDLSDDAVGTAPSQQTIYTSDARHITDIGSSGITIHPEDGSAGNYMQLDSDGLKIYKSSTLLANYGTTVTIGNSSAKNVYIDSNGVQIRDGSISLASFGTTVTIGKSDAKNVYIDSGGIQLKNSSTTIANFGSTITIGQSESKNIFIDSNGINIKNGSNILANFSDTITIGQNTGGHAIITNDGMEIFINSNTSVAYYGESARIGEENNARLELSSVELSATNQDGIEGFKVEMDAPGLVAYPKISSATYSTTTPVTINFHEELENDTLLYGGADIEIGWKERPIPPEYTTIEQAAPWLRGDYNIAQVTWSSTDGWTYTDYYCAQDSSLANASSTCKVIIPFGFSNNNYNNNNAYQFQYGTSKSITVTGNVQHFYRGANNTTITAVIFYDGNSSITITVSDNSSDLFDYIKMPYVCYQTTTDYSTAITAGTRSGNTGAFSAIFGQGLYAENNCNIAFGRYNYVDTSSINNTVLTIGNGDNETNRSNALTVDWSGNVDIASGAEYRINGKSITSQPIKVVQYGWVASPALSERTRVIPGANPANSFNPSDEPSSSEYTFVAWITFTTNGWCGAVYPATPMSRTSDLWTATAKAATTGVSIYGTALYVRNDLL